MLCYTFLKIAAKGGTVLEQRILACLHNTPSTEYILPFFWQHGEDHAVLAEEMAAIRRCGIGEICVESRPHEQFGEDKWWDDFGFILQEASRHGMRVWLLDDKQFPTGYANGYIERHPALRAVNVRFACYDFVGPQADIAMIVEGIGEDESFLSITAYRRDQNGDVLTDGGIDLMPMLDGGLIWWDVPDGAWRVCYVVRTQNAGPYTHENYIDMLSAESCKAMLHAVYEPHYDRYAAYFGNTFAGFFSDEPSFANSNCSYCDTLGKPDLFLPWNDELPSMLAAATGLAESEIIALLPALWQDITGQTATVRTAYMDAITKLYRDNFSRMLGNWCRERGVMYFGHIIEYMNTHQRLGCGAGHFFRATDGQDMAGCDVVLNQITPGKTDLDHVLPVWGKTADPAFFNYTLAKLASSQAHINPRMKNRAMCELYGAGGWGEGLPTMKYVTDLMLASGINHFVPHAFNPQYPDWDCPPFFFARGNNSQFPLFGELLRYLARSAHVMSGGIHQADVAVYYNAEAEWAGGRRMLQQDVCRTLTRAQIDFDLIPQDALLAAAAENGRLAVNEETYGAVVVPYSQYLPHAVMAAFHRLESTGVPVIFADALPDDAVGMTVKLADIPTYLIGEGHRHVKTATPCPSLRFYHIRRDGHDVILFWNEDIFHEIDTAVAIDGDAVLYDAWRNRVFAPQKSADGIRLKLAPGEALILCVGESADGLAPYDYADAPLRDVALSWDVSLCEAGQSELVPHQSGAVLGNLAKAMPSFAGVARYESTVTVTDAAAVHTLDLGRVGEAASLWVNGQYVGAQIAVPYRFDVSGLLRDGDNTLRVEVVGNLGYHYRDHFSRFLPLPPFGLIGPVTLG